MNRRADTKFAPAGRVADQALQLQKQKIAELPLIDEFYDAVSEMVMILNPQRQIVFCNQNLAKYLNINDKTVVYSRRPGEVFHCLRAHIGPDGCGTSEFCSTCGAVDAVLESQAGRSAARECHISLADGSAMELLIRATPFFWEDEFYSIVAVTDISHEKRRRNLEQIFFHDIKNTVVGIRNIVEHMTEQEDRSRQHFLRLIYENSIHLIEEIDAQRGLAAAENGELKCRPESIEVGPLLSAMRDSFLNQNLCKDRSLLIEAPDDSISFFSDVTVLRRVLSNMIKNALEYTAPGCTVRLGCDPSADGGLVFYVCNPGCMPAEVQFQVFNRFFSTKGEGRGLGAYAVKLLTERYLSGSVDFTSTPESGTRFEIRVPLDMRGISDFSG